MSNPSKGNYGGPEEGGSDICPVEDLKASNTHGKAWCFKHWSKLRFENIRSWWKGTMIKQADFWDPLFLGTPLSSLGNPVVRSWKPWKPCKTLQGLGKEDLARPWKVPCETLGKVFQGLARPGIQVRCMQIWEGGEEPGSGPEGSPFSRATLAGRVRICQTRLIGRSCLQDFTSTAGAETLEVRLESIVYVSYCFVVFACVFC